MRRSSEKDLRCALDEESISRSCWTSIYHCHCLACRVEGIDVVYVVACPYFGQIQSEVLMCELQKGDFSLVPDKLPDFTLLFFESRCI